VIVCPQCQHADSKVLDTRSSGPGIRRRRSCLHCEHRFTTFERLERRLPLVVKKDGSREPFEREKIREGLGLACRKRPVAAAALEAAATRIEQDLADDHTEVASQVIGHAVLRELKRLDKVAYLRFASVYLEIGSPEDFHALLQPLLEGEVSS